MPLLPDCKCGHAEKEHCKGHTSHAYYKDVARMVPKARKHECTTRHCEAALCCCTNYRPKEDPDANS